MLEKKKIKRLENKIEKALADHFKPGFNTNDCSPIYIIGKQVALALIEQEVSDKIAFKVMNECTHEVMTWMAKRINQPEMIPKKPIDQTGYVCSLIKNHLHSVKIGLAGLHEDFKSA
jgi:hypothetical protein